MENKFNCGDLVKDRVTDFEGIVLGITKYASGCIHYGIQAKISKDNKIEDWKWFDQGRLDLIKANKVEFDIIFEEIGPVPKTKRVGGPAPDAPSL